MKYNKTITRYWMKHYTNNGLCVLCGNHGTISNDGVKSPAGVFVTTKIFHYCICPNGQVLREQSCKLTQRAADGLKTCGICGAVSNNPCPQCGAGVTRRR